jgi:dienelactone hydrolase
MRHRLTLALVATIALLLGTMSSATAGSATTGLRFFDITTPDGVVLKANVDQPTTPGRHPAIVFINSWTQNDLEYLAQATKLAGQGYVVLSYTTRGMWFSGGTADIASPKDVADVSTVIDYLIAHTSADPNRIGTAGISYGAGLSLLAAGHDPRIKATAAMSGWVDLGYSLFQNQTRDSLAPALLVGAGEVTGHPDPELTTILSQYYQPWQQAYPHIPALLKWAAVRSAATYLDAANRNHSAIFMANAFGDSFFPPDQLVGFYQRLTGPKKLEFAPGDHATVEGLGLAGLPNAVWTDVGQWFDHYLAGKANGVHGGVVLTPQASSVRESYPSWSAISSHRQDYALGGDGTLGGTANGSTTIRSGKDIPASSGIILASNALDGFTGIAPQVAMASIDRHDGGVWQSAPLSRPQSIRGIPQVKLTFTPSAKNGTLVAYLYDVNAAGTGKLMTYAPYSYAYVHPGASRTIDLSLSATADDLPAGHRIGLVIATKDSRFIDIDQSGSTVTFTAPSTLELPLR